MADLVEQRFITLWRKTGEQCLDWDFHVSDFADEVPCVILNLKAQGVRQFSTYCLGEKVAEHSDDTRIGPPEKPNG
jgi:hypothetical protein